MPSSLVANPPQSAQTARSLNITDRNARVEVGSFIALAGRILFSAIFILSGFMHFSPQEIGYAVHAGVPMAGFLVPASGVLALLGGLSILLGYRAKIGAWLLVLFLVPVTLMMHNFWAAKDAATA